MLPPGTDPVAVLSSLTNSDPSVSIPGLGFIMNFTTVSGNGKASVDPIDPNYLPGAGDAERNTNSGSKSVAAGTSMYDTIGTALDISAGTATVSGDITITMPYDESTFADGVVEADLVVLHYDTITEAWGEESNCTIDTNENEIQCTVTSLSPFSIGSSVNAVGAGGMACDTTAYLSLIHI